MNFEEKVSDLNEDYFFKEFTYTKNKFINSKSLKQEVEVADNIVSLDDIMIIYQLKERVDDENSTKEKEENWFRKKIIKKATKQIRDTLRYLTAYDTLSLNNQRGHSFSLATTLIQKIHKLVLYKNNYLPENCKSIKFHLSSTINTIIHILPAEDYFGIVQNLITPAEVSEYFSFRESLIQQWKEILNTACEQAIVGQFLSGKWKQRPENQFLKYLTIVDHNLQTWDMVNVLRSFQEKITETNTPIDYYPILKGIAKLRRYELGMFKERYIASFEACKSQKFELPYRMAVPRLDCGFLFIPSLEKDRNRMRNYLVNLTEAHKYEQKLTTCIGVIIVLEGEKTFFLEWCYVNYPWEENIELDETLQNHFPFREVKPIKVARYKFKEGF